MPAGQHSGKNTYYIILGKELFLLRHTNTNIYINLPV
jgi:hypothetical protein